MSPTPLTYGTGGGHHRDEADGVLCLAPARTSGRKVGERKTHAGWSTTQEWHSPTVVMSVMQHGGASSVQRSRPHAARRPAGRAGLQTRRPAAQRAADLGQGVRRDHEERAELAKGSKC